MDDKVEQYVNNGEDHRVDYKRSDLLGNGEKIAKHLVAFANRHGGKLIFGITDDQKIEGADITENIEVGSISRIARSKCSPPVTLSQEFILIRQIIKRPVMS